jgi:hypothetical protein
MLSKLPKRTISLYPRGFAIFLGWAFVSAFLLASPAQAYRILFYHNSLDGTEGALLKCVSILEEAGHQVSVVDVKGRNYDPTGDNWGAPIDQVWDMRFVDRDSTRCGSGIPQAPDYFGMAWRNKAVSYLNHCGKFFIAGEHYQLADRNEGLYRFLERIQAVKKGYDPCPPSARGNSTTNGPAVYPVRNGLGPVSFFGAYVGGIPLDYLTGTSFVQTRGDWQEDDRVNRSIVSGWTGEQLGGSLTSPFCARGRLFMVWDATMWTYWQPAMKVLADKKITIWDESSWVNLKQKDESGAGRIVRTAQKTTRDFFPAVAQWLGNKPCPCAGAPAEPVTLENSERNNTGISRNMTLRESVKSSIGAASSSSAGARQKSLVSPQASSKPETVVFTEPPVYVYMKFADGPGQYRLDVFNAQGGHLRTIFNQPITTQKESWTSWDGINEQGRLMSFGRYYVAFSKDGRILRNIFLTWIAPQ